jgi:hypothetical protein
MIALITGMLLSLPAVAAINTQPDPSHNMDDVMSTGVIYINHRGETMPQFAPGLQKQPQLSSQAVPINGVNPH